MIRTFIALFILLNAFTASASETFDFVTHTRPPVSDFLREILQEAFRYHHKEITLEEMPGKRAIMMVNEGIADGDPSRVKNFREISNDDTSNYVIVDEPIVHLELAMLTLKDTPVAEVSWASVNQGNASYLRGSKRIRDNIEEHNRNPVDKLDHLFRMVELKMSRSAILFRSQAKLAFLENPELKNSLVIHDKPLASFNMYVYLNKRHSDFVPKLKGSLERLKTDGTFQRIADKHLVSMPVIGKD